jgi:SAM-dependent methyltransferase
MDPKHLDELIATERDYWWHVAKRELALGLLKRYAPPPPGLIVEGGIGGGAMAKACQERGFRVHGLDLMPGSVEHGRALGLDDVHEHDLGQPWPVEAGTASAVLLLDVIEHVPDPGLVLSHARATLKPGGCVIVTVPAMPSLYGPWDRMLGHYRRYQRAMLREHAAQAGLKPVWMSSWNSFTLPAALVVRGLERRNGTGRSAEFPAVSRPVNAVLKGLAATERAIQRVVPVPIGLSLAAVLRPTAS